jgi:hypothetical protein
MKILFSDFFTILADFRNRHYQHSASPAAPAAVLAAPLGASVSAYGAAVAPGRPSPPDGGVLVAGSSSPLRGW